MKREIWGSMAAAYACAILGFTNISTAAAASHAAAYLDDLQQAVELTAEDEALTTAQRNAVTAAARTLNKKSKTFAADLGLLARAATSLNAHFVEADSFVPLEEEALDAYSAEAHAQIEDARARIGTNRVAIGLSNQLVRAEAAVVASDAIGNVPARARALANAFNKLRAPIKLITAKYPLGNPVPPVDPPVQPPVQPPVDPPVQPPVDPPVQPPVDPPVTPPTGGHAPDSALGWGFTLRETAPSPSETTQLDFMTRADGFMSYHVDQPEEEEGTWRYTKTGTNTAVLHLNADYPGKRFVDIPLVFTSPTTGTFTATTFSGVPLQGTFNAGRLW